MCVCVVHVHKIFESDNIMKYMCTPWDTRQIFISVLPLKSTIDCSMHYMTAAHGTDTSGIAHTGGMYVCMTCTCTCCAVGDCLTSRPKGRLRPRELWFSIYSCKRGL